VSLEFFSFNSCLVNDDENVLIWDRLVENTSALHCLFPLVCFCFITQYGKSKFLTGEGRTSKELSGLKVCLRDRFLGLYVVELLGSQISVITEESSSLVRGGVSAISSSKFIAGCFPSRISRSLRCRPGILKS
jgi:hypothetical protein